MSGAGFIFLVKACHTNGISSQSLGSFWSNRMHGTGVGGKPSFLIVGSHGLERHGYAHNVT